MASENPYEEWLGRRKLSTGTKTCSIPPTGPLFPVRLKNDVEFGTGSVANENWRFQAKLLNSARAIVTEPHQISLLRGRGCYGYLPSEDRLLTQQIDTGYAAADTDNEEVDQQCDPDTMYAHMMKDQVQKDDHSHMLYLTDEEIMFLFHTLGCLDVILPSTRSGDTPPDMSNSLRLWFHLCSGRLTDPPLQLQEARAQLDRFCVTELDLIRRYAAYVYYRARGWIVKPGLALGGVHFLLYAHGPSHRHAAFSVLVDAATSSESGDGRVITCSEMAAHVRVVHSVGKRLILCRVQLPSLDAYPDNPWDAIRAATVTEILIDHWTPSCRQPKS